MTFTPPTNQAEHTACRNRATACKHPLPTLAVLEETPDPTVMNPKRMHQKLFCADCGAIKYANAMDGTAATRKGIPNGLPKMGHKFGRENKSAQKVGRQTYEEMSEDVKEKE